MGIGFAVPVNTVSRILPDLLEHGRVLRAWFGVQGQPLSPRLAQALRLPVEEGLLVVQVESRSSADQAGIRGGQRRVFFGNLPLLIGGDVIVALGGQSVTSMEDLASILEDKRPGDRISVVYYRGQEKIEKEMQLDGTQGQGRFRF